MLAIVGASGVGKSTFLHIVGGLERPTSGKVLYGSVDVFGLNNDRLAQFRNEHVGFVFQFHHLLPEFTALENVMMPAALRNARESSRAGSSSALPWRGRLCSIPMWSWPTNRPATSILTPVRLSTNSCRT